MESLPKNLQYIVLSYVGSAHGYRARRSRLHFELAAATRAHARRCYKPLQRVWNPWDPDGGGSTYRLLCWCTKCGDRYVGYRCSACGRYGEYELVRQRGRPGGSRRWSGGEEARWRHYPRP